MEDNDEILEFPRIYCINLKASQDRRKRMEARFAYHGLSETVTMVEAIPRNSSLVDHYATGLPIRHDVHKWRGELACYASHLKAIRQFIHDLPSGEKGLAFICEDDILLANDFIARYVKLIRNLPDPSNFNLVTCCYMMEKFDEVTFVGKNPEEKNLLTIDPRHTWGANLYLITSDYAKQVLRTYDQIFSHVSHPLKTSEVIIRQSKGYMSYPPLAIEDGIDSDRAPEDLPYHHIHYRQWGYNNYSSSEKEHLSPLYNKSS